MRITKLDKISSRNLRLLPQSAIRGAIVDEHDRRNAIWDMFVTSKGRCFFALCAELHVCEAVGLYEYIYETNEIKCCFELSKLMCYHKDAIMPSKIHTSMSEMNDGRIIMTTHTTAQSRLHPYWHPEPFVNHVYEGYQGSNILIYDPESGTLENRGIPVPHESIYGGTYDPSHNAFYFTGFFRGHLYRYDLDSGELTDYGKVTEVSSFRLFRSKIDGNIYSASRCGSFYRINTATQKVEELGITFPKDYEPYSTDMHVQLDYIADGKDGNIYLHYIFGYNFYRYNIAENTLEPIGDGRPEDLDIVHPNQQYGLAVDERGVLWYTIQNLSESYDWSTAYLIRWDYLAGEKPRNMGLVGTRERSANVMAEMHYHDGILYMTGGNHHFDTPAMFAVDIARLESLDYDLDKDSDETPLSADVINYMHLECPEKYYPYGESEFSRQMKKANAYREYSEGFARFLKENNYAIKAKKMVPYALFREYGREASSVDKVYYKDNSLCIEFGAEGAKRRLDTRTQKVDPIDKISSISEVPDIPPDMIPSAVGRNFRAKIRSAAKIGGNRYLCGTEDGILFIWNGDTVFNLGACPNTSGEVRDICYCEKTGTAYGILGSKMDICMIFSYDDRSGVKYLGMTRFNIETGLYLNTSLSSIAVSEDGDRIAVGSDENMGAAYEIYLP